MASRSRYGTILFKLKVIPVVTSPPSNKVDKEDEDKEEGADEEKALIFVLKNNM